MGRRSRLLLGLAGALVVVLVVLRALARILTDLWWARSVGVGGVWTSLFAIRSVLFVAAFAIAAGLTFASLNLAARVTRTDPDPPPLPLPIPRVAMWRPRTVPLIGSVVVGLLLAPVATTWWDQWIRFRHGAGFPSTERVLGRSLDFYVFQLPLLRSVSAWMTAMLVMILLVTVMHYELLGGARVLLAPRRVPRGARAHLLTIVGMVALSRGIGTWWDRYALAVRQNGFVRGLGAVDRSVRAPALIVLAVIAVAVGVIALIEARQGGVRLTSTAVVVWVVASLLGDALVPRLVQSWTVNSDKQQREAASIADTIAATRTAFAVDLEPASVPGGVPDEADVGAATAVLDGPVVWEPGSEIARTTVNQRQAQLEQFEIPSLDVGLYDVGDGPEPILLGVRERNPNWLRDQQWQKRTRVVTHGVGVVALRAGSATSSGDPDFVRSGLPAAGPLSVDEERIYFGEEGAAVVAGGDDEADLTTRTARRRPYDGRDGLRLESRFRRLMLAIRLGDSNLVAPGFDARGTRLLLHRDVRRRAAAVAPFLQFDADPYPVIADGRVVWVVDAYTTSSTYPNAERADLSRAGVRRRPSGLGEAVSYLRSPARVLVDAYDGTTRVYLTGQSDPIIRTYRRAFPDLFRPADALPAAVAGQLRYPLDQLRIQAQILGRFHTTDVASFFEGSRAWQIAPAPATQLDQGTPTTLPATAAAAAARPPNRELTAPGPVVVRGEDGELRLSWQMTLVRSGGEQLRAMVSGTVEGGRNRLTVTEVSGDVDGPVLAARNMDSDRVVRREQTTAGQTGSRVLLGSLHVLPVGSGVLYVRPMFVTSSSGTTRAELALLKQVIVSDPAGRVVVAPTYRSALDRYLGTGPTASPGTSPGGPAGPERRASVGELLARADDALTAADQALRQGDLGEYQRRMSDVADLVRQARSLADQQPTGPTPSTTAPSTSRTTTAPPPENRSTPV